MDDDIRGRLRARPQRANYQAPTSRLARNVERPRAVMSNNRRSARTSSSEARRSQLQGGELPAHRPNKTSRSKKSASAKRLGKRKLLIIFLILAVLGGAIWWWQSRNQEDQGLVATRRPQPAAQTEPAVESIRLIATGDAIAHDSVNANARDGDSYNYFKLMKDMKPFFDASDVAFCNQSTPAGGEQFGISGYPVFNAPLEFSSGLVEVGCDVINLATNHTFDKGQDLVSAMVADWEKRQSSIKAFAGANRNAEQQQQVRYFEVAGMKFAFLAYSTYSNIDPPNDYGLNMYNQQLATEQINEARQQADFIMVSMRWGTEYSPDINQQQERLSQQLADLGVDLILGHGPHVLQPVRQLEGRDGKPTLVWYSLGNFLNTQLEAEALTSGMAVMDIDPANGQIVSVQMMPIYMHYDWPADQRGNLLARTNLALMPLDKASEAMARAAIDTTPAAQLERIRSIVARDYQVEMITSEQFLQNIQSD